MAMPTYESTMRVPVGPTETIAPVNAPAVDVSAFGSSVEKFGAAGVTFAAKLASAQVDTQVNEVKSEYLRRVYDLEQGASKSQDFQNAPQDFSRQKTELEMELAGRIQDPEKRAGLGTFFATHGLSSQRKVDTAALTNEADANVAGLNQRSSDAVRRYAAAGSPPEREAILKEWNADVDAQVSAGWISKKDAFQRKATFGLTTDDADALALIRINPSQALKELDNPDSFKWLGPIQRENLKNQAKAQADTLAALEVSNIATRDPARAMLTVGRVQGAKDAAALFDRVVIPIESGGRRDVVSSAGALGIAQLMPGTARMMATAIGRQDVADLDDAKLKDLLLTDAGLNRQLGLTYFSQLLSRYDGRIAPALAAYNAGPGDANKPRADAWLAKAREQFGPYFTAEQFASVIPIDETRNYVLKAYKQLGADPAGGGLSPSASLHAAAAVSAAASHQEAERISAIRAIAAIHREGDDPSAIFKSGFEVDPTKYATWKQEQTQAALAGDPAAAKALRDAEFQREMLPFRQQALRSAPAALEAFVESETARLSNSHDVSLTDKNRLDVFRETLKSVREARKENPIGLAEQAGLIAPSGMVAIDPKASPTDQAFVNNLTVRGAQANAAQSFYQGAAIAFKPAELAAMQERWKTASPAEQKRLLQTFGATLSGNAFSETLRAVMGGDARDMEVVARLAADRPDLAGEILDGVALLKTKEVGEKAEVVRGALSTTLGGQIYPTPQMQHQVVEAALALYVARRGSSGSLYDSGDQAALERAIEDVTGPIVRHNGVRTPVTPGIPDRAFRSALANLNDADLNLFGGVQAADGRALSAADVGRYAVLKPLAPGSSQYFVGMPDARVPGGFSVLFNRSEVAQPLIVDMRLLARRHAGQFVNQPPTSYQEGVRGFRAGQFDRLREAREAAQ